MMCVSRRCFSRSPSFVLQLNRDGILKQMSGGRDDDWSGTDDSQIAHETRYHLSSYICQPTKINTTTYNKIDIHSFTVSKM